jgi:hypothetical protein
MCLLAFWPVENNGPALDRAAHIAARCALKIQEAVTQFDAPPGERLLLRVGVGLAASLGGVYDCYEFVLSGPAVVEATKSAAHSEPGFCILGAEAWRRVATAPPEPLPQLGISAVTSLVAFRGQDIGDGRRRKLPRTRPGIGYRH